MNYTPRYAKDAKHNASDVKGIIQVLVKHEKESKLERRSKRKLISQAVIRY